MMDKCFADGERECAVLAEKKCAGCAFRKTSEQFEWERVIAVDRLKRLGLWESCRAKYGISDK